MTFLGPCYIIYENSGPLRQTALTTDLCRSTLTYPRQHSSSYLPALKSLFLIPGELYFILFTLLCLMDTKPIENIA